MAIARTFRDLDVYQRAYGCAREVCRLSRRFPSDERYALSDQVRRSARSVCANIAEAWRKRRYVKSFVSKLSDADAEAAEVTVWLDFAKDEDYLDVADFERLLAEYDRILSQLWRMMDEPERWCLRPTD